MFFVSPWATRKAPQCKDVLGQVYEYFLGQFALAEGKKGGQFYTPGAWLNCLWKCSNLMKGVLDPCCGSGGMFVQSEKFIEAHQDHYKKKGNGVALIRLIGFLFTGRSLTRPPGGCAKMNLAIRGIDSSNIKWNNEGSFLNDAHKDLKADFILANPPFNDSDWSGDLFEKMTPAGNMVFHLQAMPTMPGFNTSSITCRPKVWPALSWPKARLLPRPAARARSRKAIIEAGLLDCIVNLPAKLFLNTQIPACLWFFSRRKEGRLDKVLFIDARNLGYLINRRTKDFTDEDIARITETYHHWHNKMR